MLKVSKRCVMNSMYLILVAIAQMLLIFSSSVKLLYLLPYSPDFHPIKECFTSMKAYICQHGVRFHSKIETGNKEKPFMFLYEALNNVKAQDAWGWFHHSKYV